MKQAFKRAGVASVAFVMLATSSLAFAQPDDRRGQRDDRQQGRHAQQGPSHRPNHARPEVHRPQVMPSHRPSGPHYRPGDRPRGPEMHGQRGAGPNHNWYRGERVPPQYRSHHYVVNDWRGHHLSAPPRGYHWVQNGSDYLLVAIATGVIAQLILSQ